MEELNLILMYVLTGGVVIPPIIELVTHRIKGLLKIATMAVVSLSTAAAILYFEGGFASLVWNDPVSLIGTAAALLTLMSISWNQMWKKGINPFYDRFGKK